MLYFLFRVLLDPYLESNLIILVKYSFQKETCERPERRQKVASALNALTGRQYKVSYLLSQQQVANDSPVEVVKTSRERNMEAEGNPFVQRAVEVFEAEISHIDHPQ